ncbi:3-oxoacyl-[acyl-carrier protein] reductase [Rhodoligotrophos appendicifer]|uniref:SDR family oxidoreductase n=1 Tax=Rhodoligotrophos appendicifer TaxID=987056 RepID=UPI001185B238|nr:SDR family oxidoreductase [Rhodoligotrophos appendicifer]
MLAGKTAIITGAASGFGAEMVSQFLAHGAAIVAVDRQVGRQPEGDRLLPVLADVTREEDAERIVEAAKTRFGAVDILINNAGTVGPAGRLESTSLAEFNDLFQVNVTGVFLCCRAVLPLFRSRSRGNIINIASGSALRPRAGAVAYSASKGAVITMTRALALEVAEDRVRVNCICPAISRTPLIKAFIGDHDDAETWEQIRQGIPLGRLVEPADVAAAALWLASDASSMVTGMSLPVDGGRCI